MIMEIENILEEYTQLVISAVNEVPKDYYKIETEGNNGMIVRERVFCYELYYRLRCLQNKSSNSTYLTIHGEIDKRGHKRFAKGDKKNPDFVFHVAGEMKSNAIVIEVKGKLNGDYLKDLTTLYKFVCRYHYKQGVFLVYNHGLDEVKSKLLRLYKTNCICANNLDDDILRNILIVCKKGFGSEIEQVTLLECISGL